MMPLGDPDVEVEACVLKSLPMVADEPGLDGCLKDEAACRAEAASLAELECF